MNRKLMVLFAMTAAAFGQANSPGGLKVWFGDGTGLDIHTESTGASLPVSTSGSEVVPAGYDFHRVVFDKQGALLLGYDIEARKAGQGTFTVRIKPVDTDKFKIGGNGKWLDIPTLTGERPSARVAPDPAGERFCLENFRLAINGKTLVGERNTWMRGGGLMIHLPGRGEFYLALSPSADFALQPSGWIDHTILRFFAGGELVEITRKSTMLQKSDFSTVWMYHVPESDADRARDRAVEFTCGDKVESLIRMYQKKEN